MDYAIQLAVEEGNKEEIRELTESAEEAWLNFSYIPESRFGECKCGNCGFLMGSLPEILLRKELDSRSMGENRELYEKLESVNDGDEEKMQRENLSILLIWLNRGKEHKDLLRCPGCKKILIPYF